jgi:hypothetical protein
VKRYDLAGLSVKQLVDHFIEVCLAQDRAFLVDEVDHYNRLYDEMEAIREELKRRDGDQRRALVQLFQHPNAQVRLKSAISALVVDPDTARRTLQIISDRDEYPQAGDARGMMRALDEGRFIPK